MKKLFSTWMIAGLFALVVGGTVTTISLPATASAAACSSGSFLGFPTWYRGLEQTVQTNTSDGKPKSDCQIKSPGNKNGDLQRFIWTIVLNVIDIILRAIGFVAVAFIIWGGFKYITSTGSADGMAKAKSTILNAIIGLIISIGSIGIVNAVLGVVGNASSAGGVNNLPRASADEVLAGILGAVYMWASIACVLVIIIAGFYYVTSQGTAAQVGRAKSAIIASVVGLVVILMAFAITQFVLGSF